MSTQQKQDAEVIDLDKSEIYRDRVVAGVSGGGKYGPGEVSRLVGLDSWARCPTLRDERSGSRRSGAVIIGLAGPGIYRYSNLADSNRSVASGYFWVTVTGVRELPAKQLADAVRAAFPEQFEAAADKKREEEEKKAADAAIREQQIAAAYAATYGDDEDFAIKLADDDISITRILPTRVVSLYCTPSDLRDSMEATVKKLAGASAWKTVRGECVSVAYSPVLTTWRILEDGVYSYQLIIQREDKEPEKIGGYFETTDGAVTLIDPERVAEYRAATFAEEAAAIAEAARNYPSLTGTEKQIAWALRLRAVLIAREPSNAILTKATTAKYWIDSRFLLKLV